MISLATQKHCFHQRALTTTSNVKGYSWHQCTIYNQLNKQSRLLPHQLK